MGKLNVQGLALNPTEVSEVSEIVVETQFLDGELSENYDIQTGISHAQSVVFLASMGISGKALTSCTPAEIGDLVFTEKVWRPALVAGRFRFCASDENQLIKWLKKAKQVYNDYFDREGSKELQLVASAIINSMRVSIPAKVWFSDKTADTIANGGVFTNGTDLGLFNQFDGLFKQIFADANVPRAVITKNAGANYNAQKLSADEAITILDEVYENADTRLTSSEDAVFYVSGEIYKNFRKTIATKEYNGGIVETLINGRSELSYYGIKIYEEKIFDHVIKTYQNDGTKYNLPHRIVLTTKGNIPIGTLSDTDLENLRSIFDEVNNVNVIDFGYFLDALFGESYMASVAY